MAALDKLAGEIGQVQQAIHFACELRQPLGTLAIPLRLVQVAGDFEHHRNLRSEGASAANVVLRNAGVVETIEHSKHAEHFPLSAHQRDREQLLGVILREDLQVRAGHLCQIVRPEDFLFTQRAGSDAFRENSIHAPRLAPDDGPANPELAVFEQGYEAAAIAEKIGGAYHERLKRMFEVCAGTEFGRNLKQLVEFVGLALRGGAKFGMSHRYRAEAGDGRDQRLLLRSKNLVGAGIDEDCALGARRAEGRGNQHSRRDHAAERVQLSADGDSDHFSAGNRALRQIGGEANRLAVVRRPKRIGQLRSLGGHGPQLERSLAAQKDGNQARTQQQPETISQSFDDGGNVGSAVQRVCNLSENRGAAMLLARSFAQPGCFEQAAELSSKDGGLGGEIFIKESVFRIMGKRRHADDFIEHDHGSNHQRARPELAQRGVALARLDIIDDDRAALAHGLGCVRAVLELHAVCR